mgnify:CR=1 FL=1
MPQNLEVGENKQSETITSLVNFNTRLSTYKMNQTLETELDQII